MRCSAGWLKPVNPHAMERTLITVTEYCGYHPEVEPRFIRALAEGGLIGAELEQEEVLIPYEELCELERLIRFHYELDINLEGIEAISNMLRRMNSMQDEIRRLRARVAFLEKGERTADDLHSI